MMLSDGSPPSARSMVSLVGVCDGNVLNEAPVLDLLQGSWQQSAVNLVHTPSTATILLLLQYKHVVHSYSKNVNVQQHRCFLLDTIQQCCKLLAALLAGCHVHRPFQRAPENMTRSSKRSTLPPATVTLYNLFSIEISAYEQYTAAHSSTQLYIPILGRHLVTAFTMTRSPDPKRVSC